MAAVNTSVGETENMHDDMLRGFADQQGAYDVGPGVGMMQEQRAGAHGGGLASHAGAGALPYQSHMPYYSQHGLADENVYIEAADRAAAEAATAIELASQKVAEVLEAANSPNNDNAEDSEQANSEQSGPAKTARRRRAKAVTTQDAAAKTANKGLRHFSMKVCEKVEAKGSTTYNEVADELVQEFSQQQVDDGTAGGMQYDEKNIRRRVYDALNVLMAMDIIVKDKKEIHWKGLPSSSGSNLERLKSERARLTGNISKQQAYLKELLKQLTAYKNLIVRNKDRPLPETQPDGSGPTVLQLPFILIQADADAAVEIQISDDAKDAHFDFHGSPFKIYDDNSILYQMGLHQGPGTVEQPSTSGGAAPRGSGQAAMPSSTPEMPMPSGQVGGMDMTPSPMLGPGPSSQFGPGNMGPPGMMHGGGMHDQYGQGRMGGSLSGQYPHGGMGGSHMQHQYRGSGMGMQGQQGNGMGMGMSQGMQGQMMGSNGGGMGHNGMDMRQGSNAYGMDEGMGGGMQGSMHNSSMGMHQQGGMHMGGMQGRYQQMPMQQGGMQGHMSGHMQHSMSNSMQHMSSQQQRSMQGGNMQQQGPWPQFS